MIIDNNLHCFVTITLCVRACVCVLKWATYHNSLCMTGTAHDSYSAVFPSNHTVACQSMQGNKHSFFLMLILWQTHPVRTVWVVLSAAAASFHVLRHVSVESQSVCHHRPATCKLTFLHASNQWPLPFLPSSCLQTLHKSSARGECFVVDSEVITSGIPYQDYFYTIHRYCLTSINKHKSRLR